MKKTIALVAAVAAVIIATLVISKSFKESWTLVSDDTTATVYNAVPEQCDADFVHAASMYEIDLERVSSLRVLAMERTMIESLGFHYGDIVLIQGAGEYDGYWRILDTVNKRFAGQHIIDFLVPNHITKGKWTNVRVYSAANKWTVYKANKALKSI